MPKPKESTLWRDAMIVATGFVAALALFIELTLISPDNPVMAVVTVMGAGLLASAETVKFWQV